MDASEAAAAGTAPAPRRDTPNAAAPAAPEPLLALLQGLLHDLPGLVADRVELLALELKRAGRALAQIALLVIAVAALALTAWIALWIGIAELLVRFGVPWLPVLLGLHALGIWLAVRRVRALARLLSLPASRRHLTKGLDAFGRHARDERAQRPGGGSGPADGPGTPPAAGAARPATPPGAGVAHENVAAAASRP